MWRGGDRRQLLLQLLEGLEAVQEVRPSLEVKDLCLFQVESHAGVIHQVLYIIAYIHVYILQKIKDIYYILQLLYMSYKNDTRYIMLRCRS